HASYGRAPRSAHPVPWGRETRSVRPARVGWVPRPSRPQPPLERPPRSPKPRSLQDRPPRWPPAPGRARSRRQPVPSARAGPPLQRRPRQVVRWSCVLLGWSAHLLRGWSAILLALCLGDLLADLVHVEATHLVDQL